MINVNKRKRNDNLHHYWTEDERTNLKCGVIKYGKRWELISKEVFHGKLSAGQCASQYGALKNSMYHSSFKTTNKLEGECNNLNDSLFKPVDERNETDDHEYLPEITTSNYVDVDDCILGEGPIHRPHIITTRLHKYLLWNKSPFTNYHFEVFYFFCCKSKVIL